MDKEELNKIINIVASIDVHNETEAIAKEELMSYAKNLQQRIDKTLTTIDEMINGTYILQNGYTHVCYNKDESSTIRLKIIKKILQGEEGKDNEC